MIKGLMREVTLAIQAKSGVTPAFFVWAAVVALASLTAFAFLCVAAYDWLAQLFGNVFAGLIVAGFFILVAAIAAMLSALARRRARERAVLERAARAHAGSWLLDPENSRARPASRPLARLAAPRVGGATWLHGRAMGARGPQAPARGPRGW